MPARFSPTRSIVYLRIPPTDMPATAGASLIDYLLEDSAETHAGNGLRKTGCRVINGDWPGPSWTDLSGLSFCKAILSYSSFGFACLPAGWEGFFGPPEDWVARYKAVPKKTMARARG